MKLRGGRGPGWFGPFGGQFAPETLQPALSALVRAYDAAKHDRGFRREFREALRVHGGRPSPLTRADALSRDLGRGIRVFLKREDLNHTGSHKINNVLGQLLLARRMGKRRVIAETGAGQHGVAAATAAAIYGAECVIYMGAEDVRRQALNVFRMELLGARVVPVTAGTATLKDAINEAFRDWISNVHSTHYVFGSVAGPHPFPTMVRDFQSVIGREARAQMLALEGRLPTHVLACVGGGSNAMGIFSGFLTDRRVRLIGVEAGGRGRKAGAHAATLTRGRPGILHGSFSYLLQDRAGQIQPTHSISAGLDYPGVGPEHAWLKATGRAQYVSATDREALEGFLWLAVREGILPALEPAHALGYLKAQGRRFPSGSRIVVNLSGRGDKDVEEVRRLLAARRGRA